MHVLFIVLNRIDKLDDVLAIMLKAGVKGATILDSQGMGSVIATGNNNDVPMFGTLKAFFDRDHPYSKTIFTVIHNDELLVSVTDMVQSYIDAEKIPNTAFMFSMPIGKIYGV